MNEIIYYDYNRNLKKFCLLLATIPRAAIEEGFAN